MKTYELINSVLETLSPGEIFTTRQMLKFGHRKQIDLILHRLVKQGIVRRLSNGVFCRVADIDLVSPTVQDVTAIKSKANSVRVIRELGSNTKGDCYESPDLVFYTKEYSGTFLFLGRKVTMKKICGRKYELSQSDVGNLLLKLWLTGSRNVSAELVRNQIESLSLKDKAKLRGYLPWIPGWLHNHVIFELIRLGL